MFHIVCIITEICKITWTLLTIWIFESFYTNLKGIMTRKYNFNKRIPRVLEKILRTQQSGFSTSVHVWFFVNTSGKDAFYHKCDKFEIFQSSNF